MEATSPARNFGPLNPETFFAAQKRNRRATWRMSALCTFAAFIMGIPLTLVLTPLLYAGTMIVAEIINHFAPLPPDFWRQANDLAKLGMRVADYVINQKGTLDPGELAAGLTLVLLPGMVVAYGLWFAMLALFRHGGVGGTLASMNAREPNQADLKELQLADVAQEMAIAAGLPAPRIMLVDSIGANAAAVGTSMHDARIVISRRLLDDLDRDQMQAILAHLVGSIGNGDLGIAFTVTSVFETCGLLLDIINAPFGKESRSHLWRVARYMLGGGTPEKRAADAAEIAESLATSIDADSPDMDQYFKKGNPGLIKKAYRLLIFPLMFTNMAIRLTLWIFLNALLGPSMAMLWRTRRYLADASSVELTRNPDALARALQCLSEDNTAFDSGDWATHLFVVNPKGDSGLRGQQPSQQQMAKAIQAWASTAHVMSPQEAANLYDVPVTSGVAGGVPAGLTPPGVTPNDWPSVRQEIITTVKAAAMGDQRAAARLQAIAGMMGERLPVGLGELPNFADIQAASHGDKAAIERLKLAQQGKRPAQPKHSQSSIQSFASFHPPLVKRAKRLQKMGSHMIAPVRAGGWVLTVFMTLLYLIIVPLLTVAGGAVLMVIGILIGMNLMLLAVWLTAIHWFFVWLNGR
ncbi:MAG TPA: M48 family metalloprotease [Candidatus Angelobacter sp.]|jgi:Zn-dependent protease with chaperone function